MKNQAVACFALISGLWLFSGPAFAHHGTSASYDMNKPITVSGTVTEFVWANPHARLFLDVTDPQGKVVNWGVELRPAPNGLSRAGWTRHTIAAGDKVTISGFPSKFGTPAMVGETDFPIVKNGEQLPGTGGGPRAGGAGRAGGAPAEGAGAGPGRQ